MNVSKQLRAVTNQFVSCFSNDKLLAVRIILFIITGFTALWFFIADAIYLFTIKSMQIAADELDSFIKDENRPESIRCTMLIIAYPMTIFRYCCVPFMYVGYFYVHFFYNVFACMTGVGACKWTGIIYDKARPKAPFAQAVRQSEKQAARADVNVTRA